MSTPAIVPDRSGQVVVEGKPIYWEFLGRGGRPVVCLLNGLAMSTKSWYGSVPRLQDRFDILLFDYWGQGSSYCDDEDYSIPAFCHGLRQMLDELGLARIHLMGISYGGFIGLDFARLYSERLHSLVLCGILLTHEQLFEMYEEISLKFYRERQMELYAFYLYEKIFGETFARANPALYPVMRQKLVERYGDKPHCLEQLTLAQDRFFAALDANLPGYRAIPTPTLMLAGEHDRVITPAVQKKVTEILPNASFEVIPDCGHVVHFEAPDYFFGRMKEFMLAHSASTAASGGM